MPAFMKLGDIKGESHPEDRAAREVQDTILMPTAEPAPDTAAKDYDYKYVNVRRYDLAEEVAPDALVADGEDAPAGGGVADDVVVDGRIITAEAAAPATTAPNGGDEALRTQFGNNNAPEASATGSDHDFLIWRGTPEKDGVGDLGAGTGVDGLGDVSGDGKSDIVVGTAGSGAHVKSLEGGDDGDLVLSQSVLLGDLSSRDAPDVAWKDAVAWRPAVQDDTPAELQGPFDDLANPLSGGSAAGPYYTGSVTVSSDDF